MTERRATDEVERILSLLVAHHEGLGRAYRLLLADLRGEPAGTSGGGLADSPGLEQLSESMPALKKPDTAPTPRALLRSAEVAARLGIHPRTLRRLVHLGEVPAPIMIGKATRWRPDDIEDLVEGRAGGRVSRGAAGRSGARGRRPGRRRDAGDAS